MIHFLFFFFRLVTYASMLRPAMLTILVGNCKYYQTVVTLTCGSGAVAGSRMVWDWSHYEGQCRGKASLVLTIITEAVRCEVISTHIQANRKHSWHVVGPGPTDTLSIRKAGLRWSGSSDTPNFTSGMDAPPSRISPIIAQKRPPCENLSFRYVTTGAESEQPAGAPFYQWVGCRDHAGLVCFPYSGSW